MLGVVFKWTPSHYQPLSLMLSHIFPNQRLHVLECISVIYYYGTVYPRTLWLKTASLFVHNSLGWDLGKGLTSQFSALHSIIWDHYLAAFGWWLALDGMSKRLFSLIRHPSVPLSGHFLCGGPRVNEFFFVWLTYKRNIPRDPKADVSCCKSQRITSVTFCWSYLVTRPAQIHWKRKKKKNSKEFVAIFNSPQDGGVFCFGHK